MEQKQLVERLELMKKELARKQKKLEKAKRAARVKAHVKQKILEHNHQSEKESKNGVSTLSFSSRQNAVLFQDNQPTALSLSLQKKKCFPDNQSLNKTSNNGRAADSLSLANPSGEFTSSSGITKLDNASIKGSEYAAGTDIDLHTNVNSECKSSESSHEHEGAETLADMRRQPVDSALEIDDSFAVTPSFKSATETDLMDSHLQTLPPVDSYDSTFTLNLHTEACNKDAFCDTQADSNSVNPVLENAQTFVESKIIPSTLIMPQTGAASTLPISAMADHSMKETSNNYSLLHDCGTVTSANENQASDSDSQTVSEKVLVPYCKENAAKLKVQDTDNVDVTSKQPPSSQSQKLTQQSQEQVFDYTELDVIPFSQFELMEDFLSEVPDNFVRSSQGKGKRKSMSSLVQRRSPRLSWFEFTNSDKSASSTSPSGHFTSQQSSLFKMTKNQKKTKKALLLSSLFQFLIDEAKRDASFVEFQLPDDIASFVSVSERMETKRQLQGRNTLPCTNAEHHVVYSQDIECIPETELIPEFDSQRLCNTDLNVKNEESQVAMKIRDDLASIGSDRVSHSNVASSGRNSEFSVASNPSKLSVLVCNSKNREHRSDKGKSIPVQDQNSDNRTEAKSPQSEACISKRTNKKPLNLKQKESSPERNINKGELPVSHNERLGTQQNLVTDSKDFKAVNVQNPHRNELQQDFPTNPARSPGVKSSHVKLPSTPRMSPQLFNTDAFASPVLFGTQPEINREVEIGKEPLITMPCDASDHEDLKHKAAKNKPVFTPSKSKPSDKREKEGCDSWLTYAGCAESGSKDAVVDTVVGMANPSGEETAFILSVQTTALTLWTLDDKQKWSAEFYWYLPQTSKAQGACRIHTCDEQLTVLVWGVGMVSLSPFLMVFSYDWETQHTQRFSLPLPSHVIPESVFCHGLQSSNTVLVFATDKAYTRGKKYVVDRYQSCVGAELVMEEVNAKLVDLRLVEGLADAIVGLAEDQRLLVWNHKRGFLTLSMLLPNTVPMVSRIFSCHSFQGYLLFHTANAEASREVCLVAVSPTTATGKVVRQFTCHSEDTSSWNHIVDYRGILLALNQKGKLHMWDACSTQPLISMINHPGKISTAYVFDTKGILWLLAGQENGCLHMYSVTW